MTRDLAAFSAIAKAHDNAPGKTYLVSEDIDRQDKKLLIAREAGSQ